MSTTQTNSAPSPLNADGFRFAWDSVSIGTLKECPRKYQLAIELGWQPRKKHTNLGFGSLLHSAFERFEVYVAKGVDRETAMETTVHLALTDSKGLEEYKTKSRETLIAAIIDYVDEPKTQQVKTLKLSDGSVAAELSFQTTIEWDREWVGGSSKITFCGHLDRIAEFQGFPYVTDTKSTSRTLGTESGSSFFLGFNPDSQFSGYTYAANTVFGVPVRGVIVEGVQIAKTFTRFERGISHRTPEQIEEWRNGLWYWVWQAAKFKQDNYYPMNERSCHKYGGCPFQPICSRDPRVRDRFLESGYEVRPWNPLITRNTSEGTIQDDD